MTELSDYHGAGLGRFYDNALELQLRTRPLHDNLTIHTGINVLFCEVRVLKHERMTLHHSEAHLQVIQYLSTKLHNST